MIDIKKVLLISIIAISTLNAKTIWLEEADKRMKWAEAMEYCKSLDAKLPSKKVFVDLWVKNNKASDIKGFDLSVSYWTSDEVKDNKLAAYPFYFMEGRDTWYYKNDKYGVRCIK